MIVVESDQIQRIPDVAGRLASECANIYLLAHLKLNAGDVIPIHKHTFDHVSFLDGEVELNGRHEIGPALFFVPKEAEHEIRVVKDGTTWICFHVVRNDGEPSTIVFIRE